MGKLRLFVFSILSALAFNNVNAQWNEVSLFPAETHCDTIFCGNYYITINIPAVSYKHKSVDYYEEGFFVTYPYTDSTFLFIHKGPNVTHPFCDTTQIKLLFEDNNMKCYYGRTNNCYIREIYYKKRKFTLSYMNVKKEDLLLFDSIVLSLKIIPDCKLEDSIMPANKTNYKISAFPLKHYHNKVTLFRLGYVYNDTNCSEPTPMDSLAFKNYISEYSIRGSELACSLERKGMMHIDTIIYGVNVLKLYVSQNANRYVVYSIIPTENEATTKKRNTEIISQNKMYYLELTPYFNTESEDYHSRGLYIDGYVIKDYGLPLEEWVNVYTANNLIGWHISSKSKKREDSK